MLRLNRILTVCFVVVLLVSLSPLAPNVFSEDPAGQYVYLADAKGFLRIVDVSDPSAPVEIGVYETPSSAFAVAVLGDYAYVCDREGLRVVDVSDPAAPTEAGFIEIPLDLRGSLSVADDYVYLADGKEGLHMIDVSNPVAPLEAGFCATPGSANSVAVAGNYVYVADTKSGLRIIDVSDPAAPTEIGFYDATLENAGTVTLAGTHAYVGDAHEGLRILEVTDPAAPTEKGFYFKPKDTSDVELKGEYAYVCADGTGVHIVDVSDPAIPTEVGLYTTPREWNPFETVVAGNYLFIANMNSGLLIIDVSDPSDPTEVAVFDPQGSILGVAVAEEPGLPEVTTQVRPTDGATMVYVPAGEFLMGSGLGGQSGESPEHAVHLDAFWIDRTEVTNQQFAAFVEATGYRTEAEEDGQGRLFAGGDFAFDTIEGADWRHPEGPDSNIAGRAHHPVVQVTWQDAQAYCEWAGARLLTEAEWEKACRGTDARRYPWGDEAASCEYAVMGNVVSGWACGEGERPWPVGSKPTGASPYGALDMAGNVSEMVGDWYDHGYYAHSALDNPKGPKDGEMMVTRGGSWADTFSRVRCAARGRDFPTARDNVGGFRCAVSGADLAAEAPSSTGSVLFIGDFEASSLDYYFPMLAASGDEPLEIESQRFVVSPGSLKHQWRRGALGLKAGVVVKEIRTGKWDIVVLEEDMTIRIDEVDEFYEYAGKFNEEIRQAGGETVLYMSWQYDPSVYDLSLTAEDIAAIYNRAGAELGARVAPVGLAFQHALQERPDLDLYLENGRDANEAGYYLMMCVLYATIFDRSPVGLSYRMTAGELPPMTGISFEEEISEGDAAFLQQVAWETVQEYREEQAVK